MQKIIARYAAWLFFVIISACGYPQAEANTEDIRINLTRVMIEKARQVGRTNQTGAPKDGYDAVKPMVWPGEPKTPAEKDLDELRQRAIINFIQGFAELERNPDMKGKEIKYELVMGTKENGAEDAVLVRYIYPSGFIPPEIPLKGIEWRLRWRKVSSTTEKEFWQLETVIQFSISDSDPGRTAGVNSFTIKPCKAKASYAISFLEPRMDWFLQSVYCRVLVLPVSLPVK